MAAIGDGWAENAWVEAGWVTGAWQVGAEAFKAFATKTSIGISIGIHSLALLLGRAFLYMGEWW